MSVLATRYTAPDPDIQDGVARAVVEIMKLYGVPAPRLGDELLTSEVERLFAEFFLDTFPSDERTTAAALLLIGRLLGDFDIKLTGRGPQELAKRLDDLLINKT